MSDQNTPIPLQFVREYILEPANQTLFNWLAENAPPHILNLNYTVEWCQMYLDPKHRNDPAFMADAPQMLWKNISTLE